MCPEANEVYELHVSACIITSTYMNTDGRLMDFERVKKLYILAESSMLLMWCHSSGGREGI